MLYGIPILIALALPYLLLFDIIKVPEGNIFPQLLVFFLVILIILIFLPQFLKIIHLKHSKAYLLTDRRVLIKEGIFSLSLTSAPLDKITHITVKEDFIFKKLYNVGDIVIHTAGPTPVEINLLKVSSPMEVKNLIEELITKEKLFFKGEVSKDQDESGWSKIKI